jgi:hypothetical protein
MITKTGKVNGGKRPGVGCPKGSVNRDRTEQRDIAEQLLEEGLTPLDIMKARMLRRPLSNGAPVTDDRFAAACALAPYSHSKLTAVAVRDMTGGSAQIEDGTPSIRLLLQQALSGDPKVVEGADQPREAGSRGSAASAVGQGEGGGWLLRVRSRHICIPN